MKQQKETTTYIASSLFAYFQQLFPETTKRNYNEHIQSRLTNLVILKETTKRNYNFAIFLTSLRMLFA
jgi:hypothetical protein